MQSRRQSWKAEVGTEGQKVVRPGLKRDHLTQPQEPRHFVHRPLLHCQSLPLGSLQRSAVS